MTSPLRITLFCCLASLFAGAAFAEGSLSIGANVNMVSGGSFPTGDPFQRQQNEPSVAYSSRNNLHLLSGANDYRAVDVPGLPGGRETGDSWLSYFWSTNGGATWKSTLIPGYPQDPDCQGPNPPTLCGYAAGADPVVRAGVNGMFYYSGIVFERGDPSRSAIFVSRFIDLNNDEGGDPIRYLDTVIIDANNDGAVFLDKSWIGVDIPRGSITDTFSVVQRGGSTVNQTVACGNVYVGYAAIGGEEQNLRSEIRLATSADCGNSWDIQPISQPDSLNQGANIAIHPLTGELNVVWRRFDTVESFLGISPTGCPASPASWKINSDWPVSTITMAGATYSIAEAQALLGTKHRGDESIKLSYEVIAAKLNLLTGGGDPVPGFNAYDWSQNLTGLIADAEAWFVDHPIGSNPKKQDKKAGQNIKKSIQRVLQGSGSCSDAGSGADATLTATGETNAIMVASSFDFGETFSEPVMIDESSTFDQGSTRFSFRTTAYPSVATDANGRIYVAWAARGYATIRGEQSDGDARIVVSTSTNGIGWSTPNAIDEPNRNGHQIKPSMLFAGGQLTMVYYDFRQDVSGIYEGFVIDLPEPDRLRHTVDVRVATALPAALPVFTDYSLTSVNEPVRPSGSASRYNFVAYGDEFAGETVQVEYMVPNFPMFADGTTPFIGDYVDVAAPNLINDDGIWRFASNPGDVQVWQAVWSDNRDVIPPPDGDWSKYVAPILDAQPSLFDPTVMIPSCTSVVFPDALPQFQAGSLYTGTRNQNVYSASISNGVIVAAPGNNRPLDGFDITGAPLKRGFVIYVQNTTAQAREFRLSLPTTLSLIEASFAPNQIITLTDIEIPPYSSAVATVFASGSASTAIPVSVAEIGGTLTGSVYLNNDPAAPDPLEASLLATEVHNPAILNPAILNPAILNASVSGDDFMTCTEDPAKCVLTPAILNPAVLNPAILNPAIFNPAVLNPAILNPAILNPAIFNPAVLNPAIFNPAVLNPAILNPAILNPAIFNPAVLNPAILNPAVLNPAILNPAILNPAILNPAVLNPAILNPAILNPAILNPAILNTTPGVAPQQVDVTFAIRNDGNATTAYDLNLAAPQLEGLDYDLVVYRLNETPVAQGCELITEAQQQLIFNQTDPLNTAVDGSFYLEPGEKVLVTFSVRPDVDAETPANPVTTFVVEDLGGLVSSQPLNTDPLTQPPADEFGPPANIVPGTASATAPANAGPLAIGQQVSITATGFVGRAPGSALDTPNGSAPNPCGTCFLTSAPAISLVARIGNGPWQFVGAGPTVLTATSAGDLEFAVNDSFSPDNSGAFYVTVTPAIASVIPLLTNADFESINGGGTFPAATDWGGNTQTALHSTFGSGNPGSPDLGLRFGFNGNTNTAASSQTTTATFTTNTTYTFAGWSTDSDLNVDSSNIQFSIGYLDVANVFQSLATATYDTDGFTTWQLLQGVTYTTGASGMELGQNITVQIQAVYPQGFNVGVWFDNLELELEPLPSGLLNWWPGEGNASDIVGSNDGTLFGGTTFGPGFVNQSFIFDGIDDYMNIGQPLSESAGTVDFWVRRNGPLSANSDLFIGSVGPNLQRTPSLFVRPGGTLLWEFNNVTVQNTLAPLTIGPWYHVAMTWQPAGTSTEVRVYLDGALVDTGIAGTPTDFQADVYVGSYNLSTSVTTPQQFANASIDELDVFNRALTQAEIQAIFDAGSAGKNGASPPSTVIDNVILTTTTLTIGGPLVSYTANVSNGTGSSLSPVVLQTYIEQPGASRAAGGLQVNCGATGVLPQGNCSIDFTLNANNTTSSGSGTLIAGPATARFDLILDTTVLDTLTVPITLVP